MVDIWACCSGSNGASSCQDRRHNDEVKLRFIDVAEFTTEADPIWCSHNSHHQQELNAQSSYIATEDTMNDSAQLWMDPALQESRYPEFEYAYPIKHWGSNFVSEGVRSPSQHHFISTTGGVPLPSGGNNKTSTRPGEQDSKTSNSTTVLGGGVGGAPTTTSEECDSLFHSNNGSIFSDSYLTLNNNNTSSNSYITGNHQSGSTNYMHNGTIMTASTSSTTTGAPPNAYNGSFISQQGNNFQSSIYHPSSYQLGGSSSSFFEIRSNDKNVATSSNNYSSATATTHGADDDGTKNKKLSSSESSSSLSRFVRIPGWLSSGGGSSSTATLNASDAGGGDTVVRSETATPIGSKRLTRTMTPRQLQIVSSLELPEMALYPTPPGSKFSDPEPKKKAALLRMYQQFVLDLHRGTHLKQLSSTTSAYADVQDLHCQLLDNLEIFKLDELDGRLIEFPLAAVSAVYRVVRNRCAIEGIAPPDGSDGLEHIVVIEFMRKKLAFLFRDLIVAQQFVVCMELLIRRAQQKNKNRPQKLIKAQAPKTSPPTSLRTPLSVSRQTLGEQVDSVIPEESEADVIAATDNLVLPSRIGDRSVDEVIRRPHQTTKDKVASGPNMIPSTSSSSLRGGGHTTSGGLSAKTRSSKKNEIEDLEHSERDV